MTDNLFAYILKYSKRQQLTLVAMIFCAFPFYYFSLNLPKTIINDAINGSQFPVVLDAGVFGTSFATGSFNQIPYLFLLCMIFLVLVVINGGFKYFINVYRGILGERMLRRLRFQLIERVMKFPLSRFRQTSQGELVSVVNQETEPLAGFIGECFSLPLFQGGMMVTILIFMFMQDWKLGVAAIALYPLQSWLIPKLQRQVNLLNRERTIKMRQLAGNLGETVSGINEIRVNNSSDYIKSIFSEQLGGLFDIRVQIFRKKFFIKFLNSFIGQITPFMFFLLGGLLVIRGELSFGALVAVLAAYKDLTPPWKELLAWYQLQADARMKFALIVNQFSEGAHLKSVKNSPPADSIIAAASVPSIEAEYVSLVQPDGSELISGVSLSVTAGEWIRIIGSGSSGKSALAHLMARLENPTSGKILLGAQDATTVADAVTGRTFGYSGHDSYLFSTSIRENLEFGLKHAPSIASQDALKDQASIETRQWLEEARLSGNSEIRSELDWVDYQRAGAVDADDLLRRIGSVLKIVNLEDELVQTALAKTINPKDHPSLVAGLLQARDVFRSGLSEDDMSLVVEPLDPEQYNNNASVAENMLFGEATDSEFAVENLADNSLIKSLLKQHGLDEIFHTASLDIATTMVEIFSDLPPNHEFFHRYNLVNADEVTTLKGVLASIETTGQINDLQPSLRKLLSSLPFRMISGRHRLGILQPEHKVKILKVRKEIIKHEASQAVSKINFFTPDRYSSASNIGDNIIFGRVTFARRGAVDIVNRQIFEVLKTLDLLPQILEVGLSTPAGLAGGLLPVSRRQKIVLGRALLKRPGILIINEGLNSLDTDDAQQILRNIKTEYPDMSLLWVDNQERYDTLFDRSVVLDAGKISRMGNVNAAKGFEQSGTEFEPEPKRTASSVRMGEKIELVAQIPIFRSLDKPMLQLIAKTSKAVDVNKGERLFSQGDAGDALYVIVEGRASIVMSYGDVEVPVTEIGRNDVLGELAVLSDEPRTASVLATTDLVTLRLARDEVIDIIQNHGDVGYQLLQVITSKLMDANRRATAESWSITKSSTIDTENS